MDLKVTASGNTTTPNLPDCWAYGKTGTSTSLYAYNYNYRSMQILERTQFASTVMQVPLRLTVLMAIRLQLFLQELLV